MPINCAAIPESLAESLLFGHLAGAFTGAGSGARQGLIRSAEGGTLFLDEIGELSVSVQPKLLRFLQDGALLPIGATRASACNVRVVAATNRDLVGAVKRGEFRGDLYARLAQLTLSLPTLRQRREDILTLLLYALGPEYELSPPLAEALLLYDWPFNVREINALAETIRVRAGEERHIDLPLVSDRLPVARPSAGEPAAPPPPSAQALAPTPERTAPHLGAPAAIPTTETLIALLRQHGGVISEIARETGRSRKQVYRWLAERKLDYREYRSRSDAPDGADDDPESA